jgi:secreted PhoX family phosphatase
MPRTLPAEDDGHVSQVIPNRHLLFNRGTQGPAGRGSNSTVMTATPTRRSFLRRSAYFIGGAAAAAPLSALSATAARAQEPITVGTLAGLNPDPDQQIGDNGGYGPLAAQLDGEIHLPEGFTALRLSVAGTLMSNGVPVPGAHDGMACFQMDDGTLRLVRNHETSGGTPFGANPYDAHIGGTTTVVFDPTGEGVEVATHPSLTGLLRPCGGGPTPWGSWLAAEETTATTNGIRHGYVFEVPAAADAPVDPVPLVAMGRFNHEAVAVDPLTGCVYETEDKTRSGIFRFTPATPGDLAAGGTLEMLRVVGADQYDTTVGQTTDAVLDVAWVPITDPDPDDTTFQSDGGQTLFLEGLARGGAVFARGEGAWTGVDYDPDGQPVGVTIYWACTSGGDAGQGQIWAYTPNTASGADPAGGTLRLLFESPGVHVLGHPDNITVHPVSGVVTLCEDGGGAPAHLGQQTFPVGGVRQLSRRQRVHGVTTDGRIFTFAEQFGSEFAGACWSPDGRWFFVNIQGNATTYAITGPWERGAFGAPATTS